MTVTSAEQVHRLKLKELMKDNKDRPIKNANIMVWCICSRTLHKQQKKHVAPLDNKNQQLYYPNVPALSRKERGVNAVTKNTEMSDEEEDI